MDFVSIVTPNHMHHDPAVAALKAGFPVIIDKPLAYDFKQALHLRKLVSETQLPFAVTYTYTGYPMVKQARVMVQEGAIGDVRKVMVEYPQGWLATKLEATHQKQASWRSDPKQAGISNCFGDIGTHAANMAEYVSGLEITEVLSMLTAFVSGRTLDDDANVFIKLGPEANGVLSASQVATGEENDLKLRIYGSKGGLEWTNRDPNGLIFRSEGKPAQILRSGGNMTYLHEAALMHMRTPAGHPEGYIEAFANIYRNFAIDVRRHLGSEEQHNPWMDYPGIEDGVRGMALVRAVVKSSEEGNVWKAVEMS
jgi:predicted dehydrogenase